MKKYAFLLVGFLGILSIFAYFKTHPKGMLFSRSSSYFVPVPVSKFSVSNLPCISVQINDNQSVSSILDLGFRGQFSLMSESMSQVSDKKYLKSKKMYGIRGKMYDEKLYQFSKIKIGPMVFNEPVVHEQSEDFYEAAIVKKSKDQYFPPEPGKIGWELFVNTNILLDLQNSKIIFCDSLETLYRHGYPVEKFIKVPLVLERGLVEFDVQINQRKLRCILDTGATWNIMNFESPDQSSSETLSYDSFEISGKELGPVVFHSIPIKLPIQVDAILGMEFFENTLLFLNFPDKCGYILPPSERASPL